MEKGQYDGFRMSLQHRNGYVEPLLLVGKRILLPQIGYRKGQDEHDSRESKQVKDKVVNAERKGDVNTQKEEHEGQEYVHVPVDSPASMEMDERI